MFQSRLGNFILDEYLNKKNLSTKTNFIKKFSKKRVK